MTKETVGKIVTVVLLIGLMFAVGFVYVALRADRKAAQENLSRTDDQLSTLQTKLTALEKTAITLCYVRLDMVWEGASRRDPYYFAKDTCGPNGYRCLTVGGDISPSCYNKEQCDSACTGKCVNIPEIKALCE